jgi:hypothetical protein
MQELRKGNSQTAINKNGRHPSKHIKRCRKCKLFKQTNEMTGLVRTEKKSLIQVYMVSKKLISNIVSQPLQGKGGAVVRINAPKAHVMTVSSPAHGILVGGGILGRWSLVAGSWSLTVNPGKGRWDPAPSSFSFHPSCMYREAVSTKLSHHGVLPRHRPKSNGPEDHGLTPLKP